MERARFINYRGYRILLVDYSGLQETPEILGTIEAARQLVAQEAEDSVLMLTYVREARSEPSVTEALKQLALHNKPFVRASAVVGMAPVQRLVLEAVRLFANRDLHTFDDLTRAKDWLVEQARRAPVLQAASGGSSSEGGA